MFYLNCSLSHVFLFLSVLTGINFLVWDLELSATVNMSHFNAEEFVGNPSVDELYSDSVRKDDLKYIAGQYNIPFNSNTTKAHLRALITAHLRDSDDPHSSSQVNNPQETLEIEKVKLEAVKLRLQFELAERENARLKFQQEERFREVEREERARERQHEIHLLQLQQQQQQLLQQGTPAPPVPQCDIAKYIKLIPNFSESDPEAFFREFESTASHFKWPAEHWVWLIKPKLVGKAITVCEGIENNTDYDEVKKTIISSYSISTEGYRQAFRNLNKPINQTYTEFASEKLRKFRKWLKSACVTTYDELINLMVLEEFKRKVPYPIMVHITDKEETDLIKAAKVADVFSLIHRPGQKEKRPQERTVRSDAGSFQNQGKYVGQSQTLGIQNASGKPNTVICRYCRKEGHVVKDCPDPRCKVAKGPSDTYTKPIAATSVTSTLKQDIFKPFRSTGVVSLDQGLQEHPVLIVRDTASAQSLICKSALPNIERNLTGEKALLQVLQGNPSTPLAKIHLNCDSVKGIVKVGVVEGHLPIPDATFLLGNDLAGSLVFPILTTQDSPLSYNPTEDIEREQPTLFPVCAVTRAQARRAENAGGKQVQVLPPGIKGDISKIPLRENLEEAQRLDPTLTELHQKAVPMDSILHSPAYYYQGNILMRYYKPSKLSDDDTWGETHQVVLPQALRTPVLEVAHEGFGGHVGVKKTYLCLLNHFFWPNMRKDVSDFVKSCHTCQLVGKPNQPIPNYPLQPIQVPSEPFEKIIVDIVGPLPRTKKGNEYILTIMCPTIRYPEAFPLKNISAKNVAKHLIHMFTTYGIPKEIQSDRGSNFTSNLFHQTLPELGISQTLSTAYHPQSQGALERCHQTLKSMLRKYCCEESRDWDEVLPFLMFAIRESPQESLGCSPFELLFGRKVRGPLKVIKDTLVQPNPTSLVSVSTYLHQLRDTLGKVRKFASDNLISAQGTMKKRYDCHAIAREFKANDKVLAYLPVPGSPLSAKYQGPYFVKTKIDDRNYVIRTPNRRKSTQLVHINLLKPYYSREPASDPERLPCAMISSKEKTLEPLPTANVWNGFSNSEILQNLPEYLNDLDQTHKDDISSVLSSFSNVFSDSPGCCKMMAHDIILVPETNPIRQPPYRTPHKKKELMKKEVDYLLEHGLAVPSKSPWASPCLLVPKEGGQSRLVVDYRKVNAVTISDAYPLPRVDDLVDSVGQCQFISKIDLLKGYHQIPLTERAQLISAFVTPFGLYQYLVMPFGLRNSPATFQRTMNYILQDLSGVNVYLDDVIICTDTWPQHLQRLADVIRRLEDHHLTVNLAKTVFGSAVVTYLGHEVGQGSVRPKAANVDAIASYPPPSTRKALMRFLGMAGFYRRFCPNFSAVAAPLTRLTSNKVTFKWTEDCQAAFDKLRRYLMHAPVLAAPDSSLPFILQTDASDAALGAVLLQERNGVLHPIAYHSATMKKSQRSYSTIEKELLAIVSAIGKFECYLYGQQHILVYTDHNPLTFLTRNQFNNQRLLRWSLFLQPYDIKVKHIKGSENIIADALSRID